jgi:probable phosphoglycerate mutase
LLIAHGHFLRILTARWIGLASTVARNLKLATASRSILRTDGGLAAIERWNERCA